MKYLHQYINCADQNLEFTVQNNAARARLRLLIIIFHLYNVMRFPAHHAIYKWIVECCISHAQFKG